MKLLRSIGHLIMIIAVFYWEIRKKVTKCLICLDVTEVVLKEAVRIGAQLIVSHHPVIFHPVRQILAAACYLVW